MKQFINYQTNLNLKSKVFYEVQSSIDENILPLFVGSINNYFSNVTEVTQWQRLVAADPSQFRTMTSDTENPID